MRTLLTAWCQYGALFDERLGMRRADRLLQIVQILRRSARPVTAQAMAAELEVATRTIYRDVASLQSSRVPIDGEVGVGYILRAGYDLPPMMFNTDEIESVVLGLRMVAERGDPELTRGARDALAKIKAVVPASIGDQMSKALLLIPHPLEDGVGFGDHVAAIRNAVRENRKLQITYADTKGQISDRTIWPLGLYLFSHVTVVCAWCERRSGFRSFRSERIRVCRPLSARFDGKNGALLADFLRSSEAVKRLGSA